MKNNTQLMKNNNFKLTMISNLMNPGTTMIELML